VKVAIVSDWMYGGGAERVVAELHTMFPNAPIYTSYCSDEWQERLGGKVVTGYLQKSPFRQLRKFLPVLRQRWFRGLDLSEFDLVISCTGNGEAKFARATKKGAKHICYCFTPVHYYWRHFDVYMQNPGFRPKWLVRLGLKLLVKPLRKRDYKAAQLPDYFVGISEYIKADIKQFYGRDAIVIHPPVDAERFAGKSPGKRHGFVTMGRQTPYKRTDLIIEACNELGLDLTVIGRGPEHDKLFKLGGPTVTFKVSVSDIDMPGELASAEAFIFAAQEDFGIAPVEAMAAGVPVIAYKAGGALDFVVPGKSGEFFEEQTTESLEKTLRGFKSSSYKAPEVKKVAGEFSVKQFENKLRKFIASF
jgi:glycosyltransferase involved in cell wall biosynthesis